MHKIQPENIWKSWSLYKSRLKFAIVPEQGKVSSKVELYPLSKTELKWNIDWVIPQIVNSVEIGSPYVAYEDCDESTFGED